MEDICVDSKINKILTFLNANCKNSIEISLNDSSFIDLLDVDDDIKRKMLITFDIIKDVPSRLIIKSTINTRYLITLQSISVLFSTELTKNVSFNSIKITLHNLLKSKVLTFDS